MSTFDSTKRPLTDLLNDIVKGKIQLPDFQRGWVWDDDHIRGLLVSIARSFPIGAVMLLETGGDVRFQERAVQGVRFAGETPKPEALILDGQQRLTSLTQVLALRESVKTFTDKGKAIERYYYFDIDKALEGPQAFEDAIIAVDAGRKVRKNFGRDVVLDLSTVELECQAFHFPCNQIMDSNNWQLALHRVAPERVPDFLQFFQMILDKFRSYYVPVIVLKRETSKEAVCLVFEKVNTGGVPLSVFELVTATYAADGFNLRDDWLGSEERSVQGRTQRMSHEPLLATLESTDFLQALAMLETRRLRLADVAAGKSGKQMTPISAKRTTILSLPLSAYQQWADTVEQGFKLVAKFLRKECIYSETDLPYRTQLPALAAVLAIIGDRWLEPRIHDKLSRWYWCGVVGELYGGAVETRMANDVEDLLSWIENDTSEIPRTVGDASFQPDRLDRLMSRLSAAYKGINVLVLREGAKDFFWKETVQKLDAEEVNLDIHHIFPQDWCEKEGIPRSRYNSIVNKTPISARTNRMIGGVAPSKYLQGIQKHSQVQLDDTAMDKILDTHLIFAQYLRDNDFEGFYTDRKRRLIKLIEGATKLSIVGSSDDIASVAA